MKDSHFLSLSPKSKHRITNFPPNSDLFVTWLMGTFKLFCVSHLCCRREGSGKQKRREMAHAQGSRIQEREEEDSRQHFSTFAMNAANGEARWHHLPGDFTANKVNPTIIHVK